MNVFVRGVIMVLVVAYLAVVLIVSVIVGIILLTFPDVRDDAKPMNEQTFTSGIELGGDGH